MHPAHGTCHMKICKVLQIHREPYLKEFEYLMIKFHLSPIQVGYQSLKQFYKRILKKESKSLNF